MTDPTSRARVCLVTTGHPATNPRLVKEADALAGAGYAVRVVAATFLPWADQADAEFAERPWPVERIPFGAMASKWTGLWQRLRRRVAGERIGVLEYGDHNGNGWTPADRFHNANLLLTKLSRATGETIWSHSVLGTPDKGIVLGGMVWDHAGHLLIGGTRLGCFG